MVQSYEKYFRLRDLLLKKSCKWRIVHYFLLLLWAETNDEKLWKSMQNTYERLR